MTCIDVDSLAQYESEAKLGRAVSEIELGEAMGLDPTAFREMAAAAEQPTRGHPGEHQQKHSKVAAQRNGDKHAELCEQNQTQGSQVEQRTDQVCGPPEADSQCWPPLTQSQTRTQR